MTIKSEEGDYILSNDFSLNEMLLKMKVSWCKIPEFILVNMQKAVINFLIGNMILTACCDCGD